MKTYLILLTCIPGSFSIFSESLQASDRFVQSETTGTPKVAVSFKQVPPPAPARNVSPWICDCSCADNNEKYKIYCEIFNTQVEYLTSNNPDSERVKEGVAILGSLGKLTINAETVSNSQPPVKCCIIPLKACEYLKHLVMTDSQIRAVAINALTAAGKNALPQLRDILQDQRTDLAQSRLVSIQAIVNIYLTTVSDQPEGELLVKILIDDTDLQIRKIALNGLIKKSNSALDTIQKNEAILKSETDTVKIALAKGKIAQAKPEYLNSLRYLNTSLEKIDSQSNNANSILISRAVSQAIAELLAGNSVTIEGESIPETGEETGGGDSTAGGGVGMASDLMSASQLQGVSSFSGVSEYSEVSQIRSSRYPKRLASEATIPDADVRYPRRMATQDTQLPILGLTDPFPQVGAKKATGAGTTPGFLDISPNAAFNITPPAFINPDARVPE